MKKRKVKKKKVKKTKARKSKAVNILGKKVSENKLKASLRDVVKKRGLKGTLVLDKKMSSRERAMSWEDDYRYANIYKYAFF